MDYRHSLLDDNPSVQAVWRLPQVLAAVEALIGEVFFLAQVEGCEPLPGRGHQRLHRDLSMRRPGDIANAMTYFDDYGPENGAARLLPGSHRPQAAAPAFDFDDESAVVQLSGRAGDILLFDVDLVHAGSLNPSGAAAFCSAISPRACMRYICRAWPCAVYGWTPASASTPRTSSGLERVAARRACLLKPWLALHQA